MVVVTRLGQFLLAVVVCISMLHQPLMARTMVECEGGVPCAVGMASAGPGCCGEQTKAPRCVVRVNPEADFILSHEIVVPMAPVAVFNVIPPVVVDLSPAVGVVEPVRVLRLLPQLRASRSSGARAPPTPV